MAARLHYYIYIYGVCKMHSEFLNLIIGLKDRKKLNKSRSDYLA